MSIAPNLDKLNEVEDYLRDEITDAAKLDNLTEVLKSNEKFYLQDDLMTEDILKNFEDHYRAYVASYMNFTK